MMLGYVTKSPLLSAILTSVSRVANRSKSRVSSSVCRNIWETSGKSLVRIHEHLAILLQSTGGLLGGATLIWLDCPGRSGEFMGDKNALEFTVSSKKDISENISSGFFANGSVVNIRAGFIYSLCLEWPRFRPLLNCYRFSTKRLWNTWKYNA